ncbi:MAG: dTDP-4-dehydrorhamnose reductase, partial [Pseudomonadota bacterium]
MAKKLPPRRVGIIGEHGQVSTYLQRRIAIEPTLEAVVIDREQLDLTNLDAIRPALEAAELDMLINPAAYTAVDNAESEPELCDVINHRAVRQLAEYANQAGVPLIHFSTDYVFAGDASEPYVETAATGPSGVYGATKLAGEKAILESNAPAIILRTAWVYSTVGKNFYKTMLALSESRDELKVVADQIGSPTYAGSIADATINLAKQVLHKDFDSEAFGVYHLSCQGHTSWAEFARSIFRA